MDRAALEKKVLECVSTAYGKDISSLSTATSFANDLSGASIMMVGLVSLIENDLDVLVSLPEASQAETIGDLIDKIEALI